MPARPSMEEKQGAEEKEEEEAPLAPERKKTHDSDLDAMLYGLCDPFELTAAGKQTQKAGGAEAKQAENTAEIDALLYDLCDPFALAEEAQDAKARRRRVSTDSEAEAARRKLEAAKTAEAAFWDCYNPFEAEAEAARARERTASSASQHHRERVMTHASSAKTAVSEYWQDITALKARNRKTSQIDLELCSRRHIGRGSEDAEEPPSLQPRMAAALLEAGVSIRPRGGGRADAAAEEVRENLKKDASDEDGEHKEEQEAAAEGTTSPLTQEALQQHNTRLGSEASENSGA